MNFKIKAAAATIMAVSILATAGYASDATPPVKKHVATKKAKTPPPPTVEEQIEKLRIELEGQINGLKTDLSEKDMQLKKAQLAAAEAQAAADKAPSIASARSARAASTLTAKACSR